MKKWVNTRIKDIKEYYTQPRKTALVYASIVFVGLLILWLYVGNFLKARLLLEERVQIGNQVNTMGTSLSLAVNQRLNLITSVHSFMEAEILRGDIFTFDNLADVEEVNNFVTGLYNSTAGIRNIAVAPDNVMQFVYPYEENKVVIGYNPAQDERSNVREEVQRAIQTREIVLSLPYSLIQGGQGLIARQAIYVNEHYWGLANIVLDLPPLLEEAALDPMPAGLKLAIRDQTGTVFYGSDDVFAREPVTYEVNLPEGSWSLAAIPDGGWGLRYRSIMWLYRGLGLIVIITIPLVVYLFINRRERLTDLVDRRTKELAQSNQTLITVLEGIDADVYVADFDTHEILFANKHLQNSFNDKLVGSICYEIFRHESEVCSHCKNDMLLDKSAQPVGVIIWEDYNPFTKRWYKNADRAILWNTGSYVHLQIATDITEHKQALEAISENEERYRQAVDNSPNPIFSIALNGTIQTWNQACEKTFQYDHRIIGQHYNTLLRNTEDCARIESMLEKVHFGQSLSNVNLVYRRYDGKECLTVSRIYPLCNHQEEVQGYVFANTDVTERKQADDELKRLLQEKEILLAEVHHRVKNNMQVIISLLGLQASEIEDNTLRRAYEESRNRIKSMTLVHEQLYRSKEYAHIEIGVYIDQLVTTLFNSYHIDPDRIQLHLTAENVYIDLERAIPCGLLLNELITNSLKYAFPDNQEGQIWINLRSEADTILLTFGDDGVGLPADLNLENTQTLGLQLIRLLTEHDLRGSVELGNSHKKGTRFIIRFPLPKRASDG